MKRLLTLVCLAASILTACSQKNNFYHIEGERFVKDGVPQYYIGTNVWYAPTLAVKDPERLTAELDTLKYLGLTNLRILATDENWEGFDIVLDELQKRGMCAVLYLNNAWEWSEDGYRSYLEKAGAGRQPHPATDGYNIYMPAMAAFAQNEKAVDLYQEHVRRIVERYKGHPAIFSWQICNEPRPFASSAQVKDAFVKYIQGTAHLIKSIDPMHMVSTGNEGMMGCEGDLDLFERVHNCPDIDYCTIHIWPYNWSWVRESSVDKGIDKAISMTGAYIDEHLARAYKIRKPLVIEEFGYPRDGFEYLNSASTEGRDKYYSYIFQRVLDSAKEGGRLAGCNFWTWSGLAKQTPGHQFWKEGDDLCGDPSQEAQGLNGVYLCDESTICTIRRFQKKLDRIAMVYSDPDKWLFTAPGTRKLELNAACRTSLDADIRIDLVSDLSLMGARDTILTDVKTVHLDANVSLISYDITGLKPGFYQVNVSVAKHDHVEAAGKKIAPQTFNIGIDPEKISSPQDKPEDFDAFWEQTLAELASVPMDIKMELLPEHSNAQRNTYRVEFKSLDGATVGGYLCEPVAEGCYRTFIDYMGYGADPYIYDPSANPDHIEFLFSVRDQGIFKGDQKEWIDRGLDSRDRFYYRGAYADVVRAIDFICSRPGVDRRHLFARGESQGGAFTWISACLDHRVTAIAPAVPFLSDYRHYSQIVSWPMWEVFQHAEAQGLDREYVLDMMRYFDVKNFTDRIECPVYMAFGLQDPTCPPHTNFAGYNLVKSPKKWYCVPTCGHAMWCEYSWSELREKFFEEF